MHDDLESHLIRHTKKLASLFIFKIGWPNHPMAIPSPLSIELARNSPPFASFLPM